MTYVYRRVWFHKRSRYDHLGRRVQKITPAAAHTYFYDAFGKLIASSGPVADVFSIRYSTKYFDPETGFYYYGYRFYSPELKRWITRDPIGEEGGVNLYAMCWNDAISGIDYLGRFKIAYITHAETSLLERIKTEDRLKEVAATNENNVYVESKRGRLRASA